MYKPLIAAALVAAFSAVSLSTPVLAGATCAEQMKVVKVAWDKAEDGPKKDAALKHYTAAKASLEAKEEKSCLTHLDQATKALK